jgi:hypothetical protein
MAGTKQVNILRPVFTLPFKQESLKAFTIKCSGIKYTSVNSYSSMMYQAVFIKITNEYAI